MNKYDKALLIALGIALLFHIQNIYIISIFLIAWSIFITYEGIKNISNRKKAKKKVFNRISIYCKQEHDQYSFLYYVYIPITIIMNSIEIASEINVNENFSTVLFVEQLKLMFIILIIIITVLTILPNLYAKFDSKKGILYEQGLILNDGKLYKFSDVKKYEFKTSYKGYKYRNIVLAYQNNETKTVYINKDDIDKFDDLLNQ